MMSEKDKMKLETKQKIQGQLQKIVHRTWYIFDPEKKKIALNTFKEGQT